MIHGLTLLAVSLAYVGALLAVAWWGDRAAARPTPPRMQPVLYALTLAVYCSSWTLFGAVGSAAQNLWSYLPIYLGPLLLLVFGGPLLQRMVAVGKAQRTASIADFLAARYGRARGLAALVAVVALVAAIPYFALQFKAIALSVEVLTGDPLLAGGVDPALAAAVLLALFAVVFGTRHVDATRAHRGLMWAIALESVVKLVALGVVALFAWQLIDGRTTPALPVHHTTLPDAFLAQCGLALLALLCLPRQFQVLVVECEAPSALRPARWLFAAYLVAITLAVLPIVMAGHALLPAGTPADGWVMALPLEQGRPDLALVAFLGGISAATGMVLVASLALATMVSNDLAMPWLMRGAGQDAGALGRRILWTRRLSILALCAAAFAYYRAFGGSGALAAYGLLAFAAVAQFAPALLGGLYWRGASRRGAVWGLGVGFATYLYTLLGPALARGLGIGTEWLAQGPWGVAALRPEALLDLTGLDPLSHGTLLSLGLNTLVFVFVSLRFPPGLADRLAAEPFVSPERRQDTADPEVTGRAREGELLTLCARVLGEGTADEEFQRFARQRGRPLQPDALADRALLQFGERLLASAVGAASARSLLTAVLRGSGMGFGDVVALLDAAGQQRRFDRELLNSMLEHVGHGVSVVDAELRLMAWNRAYQQLFGYPDTLLQVGRPVADLIRWNAERGECGPGEVDQHVARRLEHLRRGHAHVFERVRANGQTIEMRGQPLPGGGYVTTYTDISEYKRVERGLRELTATLEQRVGDRTRALEVALAETAAAQRAAEAARRATTRFTAALSHDLLQPLHAARLFTAALDSSGDPDEQRQLAHRLEAALRAAGELLDGLQDLSRIESGQLRLQMAPMPLQPLLDELVAQYAPLARARGLSLRCVPTRCWADSDPRVLRRVLQNFLANALRYTREGGVRLGVRRHGDALLVGVWDSGPGISDAHRERIFEEFQRLDGPSPWGEAGLGLGLSICQRLALELRAPLRLQSRLGRGSLFGIVLPRAIAGADAPPAEVDASHDPLHGLRVLAVDDDADIRDALQQLLPRWGVQLQCVGDAASALTAVEASPPQRILLDYHLHDSMDDLALARLLRARLPEVPMLLLTADASPALTLRAQALGVPVLAKPVRPAALRAWLGA